MYNSRELCSHFNNELKRKIYALRNSGEELFQRIHKLVYNTDIKDITENVKVFKKIKEDYNRNVIISAQIGKLDDIANSSEQALSEKINSMRINSHNLEEKIKKIVCNIVDGNIANNAELI